jgi:FkbM family methyltransferase
MLTRLKNRIRSLLGPKAIRIGQWDLRLDLANPHERKYFRNGYEDLVDYLVAAQCVREGSRVLDVGANIGLTSLIYASLGATEVVCFEPVPWLAERIRCIGCERISVSEVAVCDADGEEAMSLSVSHNQGNSLNESWPEQYPQVFRGSKKIRVRTGSLDTVLQGQSFDFMKIDIEGAEERMVAGGAEFFRANRHSVLQIEIYEHLFPAVHASLRQIFPVCFRVASYQGGLVVSDWSSGHGEVVDGIQNGPPVYVYSQKPLFG